jgi:hypothetical protein
MCLSTHGRKASGRPTKNPLCESRTAIEVKQDIVTQQPGLFHEDQAESIPFDAVPHTVGNQFTNPLSGAGNESQLF